MITGHLRLLFTCLPEVSGHIRSLGYRSAGVAGVVTLRPRHARGMAALRIEFLVACRQNEMRGKGWGTKGNLISFRDND